MRNHWLAALILAATALCGTAGARAQDKAFTIADIVFQDDQFMRFSIFGARDAARKAGVKLLEGNSNNKLDKERQLVETYVAARADAIILSPLSKAASAQTVKYAKKQGLVVVIVNTPVQGEDYDASLQFDDHGMGLQNGQDAAKYVKEKLGGKAKIAILQFKSQVPEQSEARTSGFKEAFTDMPGVEFVADQDAWLTEMAVKKAGDILTAQPELNLIWSANEGGMQGATLAVKNAGKAGKVAVFGIGASQQLLAFLRSPDDILQAVCAPPPFAAGSQAVETAVKLLRKEKVEKSVMLKGDTLSRADPEGIATYETNLKAWMAAK